MTWEEVLRLARKANDHYSLSEREQELVYELACTIPEGGRIVELGTCWGKTSVVLACAAKEREGNYLGIDNFSLEGSQKEVVALLNNTVGEDAFWGIAQEDTHASRWKVYGDIDLLLIDAGHDEENVRQDCEIWIPQVRPGGIVVWDDVAHGPGWRDSCHAAVRESLEKWAGEWEHIAEYGKVWARRKPL